MVRILNCPLCHQTLPSDSQVRICSKCHKPIARHDKWFFVTIDGNTLIQHRDCEHPQDYLNAKGKKDMLNQLELT